MFAPGRASNPPWKVATIPFARPSVWPPVISAVCDRLPNATVARASIDHRPRCKWPMSPICPPWKWFSVRKVSFTTPVATGTPPTRRRVRTVAHEVLGDRQLVLHAEVAIADDGVDAAAPVAAQEAAVVHLRAPERVLEAHRHAADAARRVRDHFGERPDRRVHVEERPRQHRELVRRRDERAVDLVEDEDPPLDPAALTVAEPPAQGQAAARREACRRNCRRPPPSRVSP